MQIAGRNRSLRKDSRSLRRATSRVFDFVALGVLAVGSCGAIAGALAWRSDLVMQENRSFEATASTAASALGIALQRDEDLAATGRTLVATTPNISNEAFAGWFRRLGTRNRYPGSFALLYIERVSRSGIAAFERTVQRDPPLGLGRPTSLAIVPHSASPADCLTRAGVLQVTPSISIPAALLQGLLAFTSPTLNYCALPLGRDLATSARTGRETAFRLDSVVSLTPHLDGIPVISPALEASLRASGLIGTLTPVYGAGFSAPHPPQGWILAIYQSSSILAPILHAHRDITAALSFANPGGRLSLLARSGRVAPHADSKSFRLSTTSAWSVVLSGPPTASGLSPRTQGLIVFGAGLVVSLLVAALVLVLGRSRARALDLVDKRTAELRYRAFHDEVTDLPNRAFVFDRGQHLLRRARQHATALTALFIDLDQFKDVNDSLGHSAGDELIRQVARRLACSLRANDTIGRLGGDEFVVLVEHAAHAPAPIALAEALLDTLAAPFALGQRGTVRVSASVGMASASDGQVEELLGDADIALYEAKATARGSYVVFEPAMRRAVTARLGLESELRAAISEREFVLCYQPTLALEDGMVIGAEALVRWQHPTRGVVLPGEFIPVLEATGMIVEVGRFVLFEACRQAARWLAAGQRLNIAVNVSARQLERDDFVALVAQALRSTGLPPALLTLEITETTLMRDVERSAGRLGELKGLGVRLAIDDFGTGYCALSYLQRFPVDALKIDRSFIAEMVESAEGAALVSTILRLGRDLKLETIAEGIETYAQLSHLRAADCAAGQGFLFARPLERPAFEEVLRSTGERVRGFTAGARDTDERAAAQAGS